MSTTFNLTENELKAAMVLVKSCLYNMGGKRPIDLDDDPFTWVGIDDLMDAGWTRHEAAGTFSSLADKGIIQICKIDGDFLTDEAYRWLDTKWETFCE